MPASIDWAGEGGRGSALRRQRRPDDLLIVAVHDLSQRLPVGERLTGGGQPPGSRRLPGVPEEALDPARAEEQEQTSLSPIDLEPLRGAPLTLDQRTRERLGYLLARP